MSRGQRENLSGCVVGATTKQDTEGPWPARSHSHAGPGAGQPLRQGSCQSGRRRLGRGSTDGQSGELGNQPSGAGFSAEKWLGIHGPVGRMRSRVGVNPFQSRERWWHTWEEGFLWLLSLWYFENAPLCGAHTLPL